MITNKKSHMFFRCIVYLRKTKERSMQIIDNALLDATIDKARLSPRLRMNHNFHTSLDAPLNRLLNAMEPGTYIRPHRHLTPPKDEVFLVLRGRAALLLFDDEGKITNRLLLGPAEGNYGADLEPGIWHCLIVLEPGTVVYEVKQGPFTPLAEADFAPWSPEASNTDGVADYLDLLKNQLFAE